MAAFVFKDGTGNDTLQLLLPIATIHPRAGASRATNPQISL